MNPYLSIIIPAYNEENKIKDTLENIKDIEAISEIIVVDDGSSDNTSKVAKEVKSDKITVITQDRNRGKGYALNNGLKVAMKKADIIGFLDADLGSSSKEVSKLIDPILNDEADVIIAKFPPAKNIDIIPNKNKNKQDILIKSTVKNATIIPFIIIIGRNTIPILTGIISPL